MAFQKKIRVEDESELADEASETVRMKFTGHFRGTEKIVNLPIPLIANSQKFDEVLRFVRESDRQGPAFCDVPLHWAGSLLEIGGCWQAVDRLSSATLARIAEAKSVNDEKIAAFVRDNEMVDA